MNCSIWSLTQRGLAAALLVGLMAAQATAQSDAVGVVRISSPRQLPVHASVNPALLDDALQRSTAVDPTETARYANFAEPMPAAQPVTAGPTMSGGDSIIIDGDCNSRKAKKQIRKFEKECKKACKKADDCDGCKHHACYGYFFSKFGCLCPCGNGGAGSPWFGCYSRVYPQDVNYFDQRDGQMYSAQGYGVPIAVPLAPIVGHTYNYGWGVPSSRLTPVSRVAPR